MNASDWFKTWVEEVILDVIVKARETELEVESEDVTEMLQSHDKALMDKEMRKKKKVASWDKIYTWQNKLWKLLKWKQRIKNTIYTVDNKAEAWFGRTDSKVEAWFGRNDSQCYCKLNRLQYSVINVTFLICPKK